MRDRITFKCSECGEENYIGTRNSIKVYTDLYAREDYYS